MGFWGIEVKPGKPYPYHSGNVPGKLRVTQATLGSGSTKEKEKSIIQCCVGHKSPIFLCSLIPNKIESCPLNLEFEEDDLVAFSVLGPQSIHLSGYFVVNEGHFIRDDFESDSFGEDIADTDSEESSDETENEYDTEDEVNDFIDDDEYAEMYQHSPVSKSGVVIEEIMDDEKSTDVNCQSKHAKKQKCSDSGDIRNSQRQIVLKRNVGDAVLESEDEDGFPVSTKSKCKPNIQELEPEQEQDLTTENVNGVKSKEGNSASLKRKVESNEQVDGLERKKKKEKQKVKEGKVLKADNDDGTMGSENKQPDKVRGQGVNQISDVVQNDKELSSQRDVNTRMDLVDGEIHLEENKKMKKNKKKKEKKSKETEVGSKSDEQIKLKDQKISTSVLKEKEKESKSSQVRTYDNGLVIEEIEMGKPNGKRASPGDQVSVHYIGKLKNGKIFDSNVGRAPFKFRLGVGGVIKGWDVGLNGMRIGDKRKLTIPPSMGYGAKGAGAKIPPNSWLIFDVELVGVR